MWFAYSEDRKGEHPKQHLNKFSGILQADGYAGFHHLYEGGRIIEAACWAHVRRKFYDIHVANGSAIAAEAIKRITGGERAAAIYTLLGTAKLNGIDPELYLRRVLERIADHPINRIHELLPWILAATIPTDLT